MGPEPAMQNLAAAALKKLKESGGKLPSQTTMPVFEDLYNSSPVELLCPHRPHLDDAVVILHSSGKPPCRFTFFHVSDHGLRFDSVP